MSTAPENGSQTTLSPLAPLARWLDLVWAPYGAALEPWRQAVDAWSRVYAAVPPPGGPWLGVPAPGPAARAPRPVRKHRPGRSIDQLAVGDSASITRTLTEDDIEDFARISGDDNPAHVDAEWAASSPFEGLVAHGILTAGLISAVLGTELPGPGAIYMSQTLRWLAPVRPGDTLTATATVKELIPEKNRAVLETVVTRDGQTVLTGEALVMPTRA